MFGPAPVTRGAGPIVVTLRNRGDARLSGGHAPAYPRAVFTAIVYVLVSECAWRLLPLSPGADFRTAHRRFGQWTGAGLWRRIRVAVLDELGTRGDIDWSRAILDAACVGFLTLATAICCFKRLARQTI